ncbi:hypothetical protein B0H13DRAFT_2334061 [Mycena leptocephala]|nr:hypothetical protein B0H13DRAFT_2334061 [Mycena leptocephala]
MGNSGSAGKKVQPSPREVALSSTDTSGGTPIFDPHIAALAADFSQAFQCSDSAAAADLLSSALDVLNQISSSSDAKVSGELEKVQVLLSAASELEERIIETCASGAAKDSSNAAQTNGETAVNVSGALMRRKPPPLRYKPSPLKFNG